MTEREGFGARWRPVLLARSGIALLAALVVLALLVRPLWRVNASLPAGLVFSAYLAWLGWVFTELRTSGRSWARSVLAVIPFLALLGFALLVLPLQAAQVMAGGSVLSSLMAAVAALSYAAIFDHVAISLARWRGRRYSFALYATTILLALMPPFAILWVQHHIRTTDAH